MNPTTDVFEKRMAELEGGVGALALAAGQTAETFAILNIAGAGDEIVSANSLYGGTYNLFFHTFPEIGHQQSSLSIRSIPKTFARPSRPRPRLLYAEIIGNPKLDVLDIEAVAAIAHEHDIPLIIDNTFATPYLCRPIEWGADIVIHSATKWIGGHGTSIGGVIVDSGKFDWAKSGKFPRLVEPDPAYHGVSYVEALGPFGLHHPGSRAGCCATSADRFRRLTPSSFCKVLRRFTCGCSATATTPSRWPDFLQEHPAVSWVNYPGLEESPLLRPGEKVPAQGGGFGAHLRHQGRSGSGGQVYRLAGALSLLANVGDAKSPRHPSGDDHAPAADAPSSSWRPASRRIWCAFPSGSRTRTISSTIWTKPCKKR